MDIVLLAFTIQVIHVRSAVSVSVLNTCIDNPSNVNKCICYQKIQAIIMANIYEICPPQCTTTPKQYRFALLGRLLQCLQLQYTAAAITTLQVNSLLW